MHTVFQQHTVIEKSINFKHTIKQGGFIAYAKVTCQLWNMWAKMQKSYMWKLCTFVLMLIHTPYMLFIKPLFSCFSKEMRYVGTYLQENDQIVRHHIKKKVFIKFFNIELFSWKSALTESDWEYILS